MVIMENYLLELIKENNRIIIPNFGAFIVSREKGQNILFNNFLSFNDGLLISHICAVEGTDSATASNKVDSYVKTIRAALDTTGSYTVKDIGTFSKDENGVLRFEQLTPPTQSEEIISKPVEQPISVPDLTTDNELLDLDLMAEEKSPVEKPTTPHIEPRPAPQPVREEPVAQPKAKPVVVANVSKPETTKKPETKPTPKPAEKKTIIKEKTIKSGTPPWFAALIILIILLLLGAFLWFFTGLLDDFKPKKQEPAVIEHVEELPQVEETIVEEPVVITPEPAVGVRLHHIIVASFREESKAAEFLKSLHEKGYASALILPHENRFLVSAERHQSLRKALQRQEELLTELKMENWVLSITQK